MTTQSTNPSHSHSSVVQNSSSSSMTSPILNLPNEVLNEAFSYIHTPAPARRYLGEGLFSEIFGIRSACRRFRVVSNELSFWYDENFDLLELIPNRKWHDHVKLHRDCDAFLNVLLSDKHLVQSLARRSRWRFHNLISFQSVMKFVPTFFQNTTAIVLFSDFFCDQPGVPHSREQLSLRGLSSFEEGEFRRVSPFPMRTNSPSPISTIFLNLSRCHRLTYLQLSRFRNPFDLNLIVIFCPRLRILSLESINHCRGTLRGLSCLKYFDVREFPSRVGVTNKFIFPTNSANSLNRLSIIHEEWLSDDDERTPRWPRSLDAFVNLTSLCVSPFTNEICDFIVRSHVRLTEFRIQLTYHPEITMSKVADMLSAPSLRNLQHLRFSVDVDEVERPHFSSFIQAIISNMNSLEELCIGMPLDLSWCERLGHLTALKKLLWYVPQNDCRNSEVLLFGTEDPEAPRAREYTEEMYDNDYRLVTSAFDTAFQHFLMKPFIKVYVVVDVVAEYPKLMTTNSHRLFQ
jgi:hypothetical protein